MKDILRLIEGIIVVGALGAIVLLVLRKPAATVSADVATVPHLETHLAAPVDAGPEHPPILTRRAMGIDPDLETDVAPTLVGEATNPAVSARPAMARPVSRELTPLRIMNEMLELTPEQSTNLDVVLKRQMSEFAAFRRETSLSRQERIARMDEMRLTHDAQLKAALTPEQFGKWRGRGKKLPEAITVTAPHPSSTGWFTNRALKGGS